MSIYKIRVKCIKCNCAWTENADETEITSDSTICPHCGDNTLKLAIFNDNIANIDDVEGN